MRWKTAVVKPTILGMALATACCGFPLPGSQFHLEPMDPARKLIGQVQGQGVSSPLLGSEVLIEGIVVRNLMGDSDDIGQELKETLGEGDRGTPTIGWFLQDEGDGNPATSDGVFVLDQGYDTAINMPAEAEFTMRMGSRLRTGDRVAVRGTVVELPQQQVVDQPRSTGHRISRGDAGGTVTAIAAMSLTLVGSDERATAIVPVPAAGSWDEESREGMRL
jgi:predicted extracellular nuclease